MDLAVRYGCDQLVDDLLFTVCCQAGDIEGKYIARDIMGIPAEHIQKPEIWLYFLSQLDILDGGI